MHVYFSGIGGAGIGPLALMAHQAGYQVSGSDKQHSNYIEYLVAHGITDIHIGQEWDQIESVQSWRPIDWIVYSSAVPKENPHHPELEFARAYGIKASKRDEFINRLLSDTGQKMIAIAGTHGKTTTTAMMIWLMKQLKLPSSYSIGAKIEFGEMGVFDKSADYFIYEADEYDRNFLAFDPAISILPGIAYDHPDIYPTEEDYLNAFRQFVNQSEKVVLWESDALKLNLTQSESCTVLARNSDLSGLTLKGLVNRQDAQAIAVAAERLGFSDYKTAIKILNSFPGLSRRFEQIAKNIYSDYAHTPEKIRGALQLAEEVAGNNVVVVYEGLHNTRQHFIRRELEHLFAGIKKLFIVPSYLAREDESLEMLTPPMLCDITKEPQMCEPGALDEALKHVIKEHAGSGDLVLCFSAGGGGSLDEWLRKEFGRNAQRVSKPYSI